MGFADIQNFVYEYFFFIIVGMLFVVVGFLFGYLVEQEPPAQKHTTVQKKEE
jgi:hypothetical protein